VVKLDLKLNVKTIVLSVLLIVGGILHVMLTADVGLSGGGFFLGLLSLGSFAAVFGVLQARGEAWLAAIIVYALLILITLAYGSYILMVLDIVFVIVTFFLKDAFGIKFKKAGTEEEVVEVPSVAKLDKKDVEKLSAKVGMDVGSIKCPNCNGSEVVVMEDASAVCKSCNVGIMDVKAIARA
jgi:hypothetical protein